MDMSTVLAFAGICSCLLGLGGAVCVGVGIFNDDEWYTKLLLITVGGFSVYGAYYILHNIQLYSATCG
jgi:hypothetical protein